MTLFSRKRPLPKFSAYPPDDKCRKVTDIHRIPPYLGDHAPRVDARSTRDSKVGEEGNIVPVKKSEPNDMECETTKPMLSNANVEEALWQWVTVDNDVEVFVKTPDQPKPIDVLENITKAEPITTLDISTFSSHTLPCVRKYPSPKIRKGVTTYRDFPLCLGKRNGTSDSNKVLGNKCSVEQMQVVDTKRTDGKQEEVPIQDGNGFENQLEGNALKEMVDKICSNSVRCETDTKSIGGKTSEYIVIQDDSVLLQNQDIKEHCQEKSIVPCEDTLFKDKEIENPILVGGKPNDLSVVPCVKTNEDVTPSKVREVLNLFQEMFTMLSNEHKVEAKGKRKPHFCVKAATLLKEQQKWVNMEKLSGPVPGVEIGDKFQFRAELVVIGLHRQFEGGIDYMERDGINFATSIVKSGRYGNDAAESYDVLMYFGQGGNPKIANKPPKDQKLTRGNLALKNSMDAGLPVRVILKTKRRSQTTYTYHGLYTVTQCRQERGEYGKLVYKFVLNRLAGQPKLQGVNVGMPKKSTVLRLPSVAADDISQGKEEKPVRVINIVDDEKLPPFCYVTNVIYPEWYESNHSVPRGCDCINGCVDFKKCPCTVRYGGDIPFTLEGAIVRKKSLVYECGPSCKCPPSCQNRVSQNGIRYRLEIFKTEKMGWGVRSRDFIQSGRFVCEYTGELLQEQEAEERVDNDEYLFDIGKNGSGFTIDAAKFGNVGRFINHSCSPNLYAQNVLYDHDDKRMPHIMFFATKNIPPLRELTYDYNYKVDRVRDGNGDIKRKDCYCGSRSCSGRLY
ncbi:hypothetical protein RHSIM_Rhsim03G0159400 [Rhododendron simsii]|uniref:Uncharacterized protein n=1 Tax=Rhododendron simsii TaxID=118357 RepID=A0A834LUW2_RHOSS|nr:hypothetical protein RHSIM_Rhsim03G0159400 [Rhododendron simsii]